MAIWRFDDAGELLHVDVEGCVWLITLLEVTVAEWTPKQEQTQRAAWHM
jgi:hypothetical protein